MMRSLLLWGSRNRWMNERMPRYRVVRSAVSRFMPGEEVDDALDETARLKSSGIGTVLTLLGENVTAEEEASGVRAHYLGVLEAVRERNLDAEVSVKLTQLGLDLDPQIAHDHLEAIAARASELDNFIWVDMEGSSYTDVTLDLFKSACKERSNLGICLQAYMYRTPKDLEQLLPLNRAIRLVKGAYAEPADVAYPKKKDVDEKYFELACRLMQEGGAENGVRAAYATHDPIVIRRIQDEAKRRNLEPSASEFQMLFGIARERQTQLARDGYRMRVLISYGSAWFPWYMRRLAERPANLWFVMRSLFAS